MTTMQSGSSLRTLNFGTRIERATAALPASTTGSLFTVAGGRVLLTSILGEVTTVIQTQANATKLVATPTVGAVNDICATLDITARAAGVLLSITGLASDALVASGATTGAGAVAAQRNAVVVAIGTIGLSCAATNTGAVKWVLTYVPLDDGATIVAA